MATGKGRHGSGHPGIFLRAFQCDQALEQVVGLVAHVVGVAAIRVARKQSVDLFDHQLLVAEHRAQRNGLLVGDGLVQQVRQIVLVVALAAQRLRQVR
ncbi:hypothetical protein D3C85_1659350 [compost metagenome]